MKKLFVLFAVASIVAGAAGYNWQPVPFEERVIALRLGLAPPELAETLAAEPIEIKALLLDYADDRMLLLKAQAALARYPEFTRELLPLYGEAPEFREILRLHGDSILPPIHYFLHNDVLTVSLAYLAGQKARSLRNSARRLLGSGDNAPSDTVPEPEVTPAQRGWFAVNSIRTEGHDFLGQFVVNGAGEVEWIQTERMLEGIAAFFAGGVRNLEIALQTDHAPSAEEIGWAALDGFVVFGAMKLLRIGRAAAASGQSVKTSTRAAALASSLARTSELGSRLVRYGKWPAIAVAAYVALHHPGVISDTLADIARLVGMPAWAAVYLGWMLLLLPALYIGVGALRLIAGIAQTFFRAVHQALSWLDEAKAEAPIDLRYIPPRPPL